MIKHVEAARFRGGVRLILLAAAAGVSSLQAAAGEFDVVVSQGTVIHFAPVNEQAEPLYKVSRENLEDMAVTGTTLMALVPGVGSGIAATADATQMLVLVQNAGLEMLDARSDRLQEHRTLFLDPRIARLHELHESGASLRDDPEAQRILGEIKRDAAKPGGAWEFAARSAFSVDGAYIVLRETALYKLDKFLGKKVRKWTVRRWNKLQIRGVLSQKWLKALTDQAIELALASYWDKAVEEHFDLLYERALGRNPTTVHPITVRNIPPSELRLMLTVQPAALMPIIAAPAPIRAFAIPPMVRTYNDEVVSAVQIENQFIHQQNYTVNSSQANTAPQHEGERSRPEPAPRDSHPSPRAPTITGSPDGRSGQTWFGR